MTTYSRLPACAAALSAAIVQSSVRSDADTGVIRDDGS